MDMSGGGAAAADSHDGSAAAAAAADPGAITTGQDDVAGHGAATTTKKSPSSSSCIRYRRTGPTDILKCAMIGAPRRRTKRELQYWQHHASPYFVCAIFDEGDDDNGDDGQDRDATATAGHGSSGGGENNIIVSNNDALREPGTEPGENSKVNDGNSNSCHHDHHHDDQDDHHDEDDIILGFISGIRLDVDSTDGGGEYGPNDEMLVEKTPHNPNGKILAIRAVIVRTDQDDDDNDEINNGNYDDGNDSKLVDDESRSRRMMRAKTSLRQVMLKHYISKMKHMNRSEILGSVGVEHQGNSSSHSRTYGGDKNRPPMEKLVAVCWSHELPMYLECGFSATRLSKATHALFNPLLNHDPTTGSADSQRLFYLELSLLPERDDVDELNLNRFSLTEQVLSLSTTSKDINMSPECYIVDSFTDRPGSGNPAAVVLLQEGFDPTSKKKMRWMQSVAAEFNLAETAFCWPQGRRSTSGSDSKDELHWSIRYYTPSVEMPLCGHATLASAAVLYQTLSHFQPKVIVFHASEDTLTMRLAEDVADLATERVCRISMDFPPKPAKELTTRDDRSAVRNMLSNAFGDIDLEAAMLFVGSSDLGDLLIELKPEAFSNLGYDSLNYKAFLEWDGYYRGVVICCMASDTNKNGSSSEAANELEDVHVDFLSRFFAPKAGIDEDDVTGSAHCILGPYFAKKLKKNVVIGRQVSKRSGIVECRVSADCVTLTGSAVVTMSGRLHM